MVVITSRRRLSGLAAAFGARLTGLDVPSATEAIRCFLRRVGAVGRCLGFRCVGLVRDLR